MRKRELYKRNVPHFRNLVPSAMEIPHNLTMIGTNYTRIIVTLRDKLSQPTCLVQTSPVFFHHLL